MGQGDLLWVGLPGGGALIGFLGVRVETVGGLLRLVSMDLVEFLCSHVNATVCGALTEFRQPIQVQSHLEMPGILVQLGHIQRT